MRTASLPRAGLAAALRRLRLTVGLLVGRRIAVYLAIDLLLLFGALVESLGSGAEADGIYVSVFLIPLFLVGLPALSDAVALERRAGSLDLALASAGGEGYFFRRVGGFASLLALQGIAIMALAWTTSEKPFPILCVVAQILLATATMAGAVLFWSLRFRAAGSVVVASALTLAALGRWLVYTPIPDPYSEETGLWVLPWPALGRFGWNSFILASAVAIFVLYSVRRVRRPESILG